MAQDLVNNIARFPPLCSNSGWTMWIARSEPDNPGHDKRDVERQRGKDREPVKHVLRCYLQLRLPGSAHHCGGPRSAAFGQTRPFPRWVTCGRRHGKSFFDVGAALVGCGHVSGQRMRDNPVMMSSTMPSAKYSWSGSLLRFASL